MHNDLPLHGDVSEADLLLEWARDGAGHLLYHAGGGCVHVLQQRSWRRSRNKQNSRQFFAKPFWTMKCSSVALVFLGLGCIPQGKKRKTLNFVCTHAV